MPSIDVVQTGMKIIQLQKENKITVKQLQERFGFTSPNAIYKWRNGECMPSIDNLVILAFVFQVSIDDIIVVTGV